MPAPDLTPEQGELKPREVVADGRVTAAVDAISPIDGRYRRKTEPLAEYFSERALMGNRIRVEVAHLLELSYLEEAGPREFSDQERQLLYGLSDISVEEANAIKAIEVKGHDDIPRTNHDVKAVEYFIKERLKGTSLEDITEWVHFGLTSEDVTNIAYAEMMRGAVHEVVVPQVKQIGYRLNEFCREHADDPMLARTHNQPATPTTFGKEMAVYAARLERQLKQVTTHRTMAKLNGATGNYNALTAAYPEVDWIDHTKNVISDVDAVGKGTLDFSLVTTQIESHDSYAELFDAVRRLNQVLLDFSQDMWRYIGDKYVVQKPDGIGSSTMPHKVNPIDFENAEGNFGLANTVFEHLSKKLTVSRLQRDLSDSTVERSIGTAFAYSLIGYSSLEKGLDKVAVNPEAMLRDLEEHPEVLAEMIQTILRREGAEMPYERLKELTQGKEVTLEILHEFINGLEVRQKVKDEMKAFAPVNYRGLADGLAHPMYRSTK